MGAVTNTMPQVSTLKQAGKRVVGAAAPKPGQKRGQPEDKQAKAKEVELNELMQALSKLQATLVKKNKNIEEGNQRSRKEEAYQKDLRQQISELQEEIDRVENEQVYLVQEDLQYQMERLNGVQ